MTGTSSALAPRVATGGAFTVGLIIVALHAIKPEYAPSWRFISEYAVGRNGWIMTVAFLVWAASCAALAVAMRHEVRNLPGKVGVAVLLIVAGALVAAGLFPQDPVTIKPAEATTGGAIHAIASMIGIPGIPLAAMLISSSVWRNNPAWAPHRALVMGTAHATWISLALMAGYLMWAVPRAGGFTSEVWAGWMNRLVVASYLLWQITLATRVIANRKLRR
jgi:hypothetical protein